MMMQTDGLLAFGGAFVTALFAITYLLYARAHAAAAPIETNIRAKIADECLKLSLIAVMGYIITTFAFLNLAESYHPKIGHILNAKGEQPDSAPFWTASVCTTFFGVPVVAKITLVIQQTLENLGLSKTKKVKDTPSSQ